VFFAFVIWVGIPITAFVALVSEGQLGARSNQVYLFAKLIFVITGVGTFLLLLIPKAYRIVSPGLAICSLLWLILLAFGSYGMFPDMAVAKLVGTVLLVIYLAVSNGNPYKMKIPGLESRSETRLKLNDFCTLPSPAPRAPSDPKPPSQEEILDAWRGQTREEKPILAIVCCSGGAMRSAIWTTVVLDAVRERLREKNVDFDRRLRLISGASGGMLGAAAYLTKVYHHRMKSPDDPFPGFLLDGLDSMTDVARRMALCDIPLILWPWNRSDRGRALEETWSNLLPPTFGELAPHEWAGTIPSIVLAPMLVQDGRRLLISNLDLEFLTKTRGPILVDEFSEKPCCHYLSQQALELRTMFPVEFPKFQLRTAVRLNASFPYVSPAVSLPTEPPRSPVDAGYYDNYGVNIACRWIEKHQRWLANHTSGIALIQIRDHLGQRDRFGFTDDVAGPLAPINRAVSFLTAPLSGADKARYAITSYRNDEQIESLDRLINQAGGRPRFVTVIFEFQNDGEVALNWQLSPEEVEQLKAGMNLDRNRERLDSLASWWEAAREKGAAPTGQHDSCALELLANGSGGASATLASSAPRGGGGARPGDTD
jgi:hypothetical protein